MSQTSRRPKRAAGQFLAVLELASAALLLAIAAAPLSAQGGSERITGTVTNETGIGLPAVQVTIVGTTLGGLTGEDGRYTIVGVTPGTVQLRAARIGYTPVVRSVTVVAGQPTVVDFSLAATVVSLDAVVAVGYTNQARRDISGAVSSVNSEAIEDRQVATVQEALRGRLPGVQIAASGEPGEASRVVIRGQNFLQSSEPLYVVDGLYMRQNPNLNPNDIASIEVLKDASAASQYGAQAANGVVVITTRRGSTGDNQVAVRSYYGVQNVANTIDMAGPRRWAEINQMAYENAGLEAPQGTRDVLNGTSTVNTNWQDAIFRQGAIQDHVLQVSGGNEAANYLLSGGFFKQEGVIINTNFDRASLRLNSEMRRGRFTFGESMALVRANRAIPIGNQLIDALRFPPVIPIRDPDSPSGYGVGTDATPTFGVNPVGSAELRTENDRSHQAFGIVYGEASIIEHLNYRLNIGFNYNDGNWRRFTREGYPVRQNESRNPAALIDQRSTGTMLQLENLLTYDRIFGRHAFTAVAGYTEQSETFNRLEASRTDFPDPTLVEIDAGTQNQANVGFRSDARLQSMLARANYTLSDRYLFSGSVRRDGSSRFGANNRFGTFGAGSVGWIVSEESFFPASLASVDFLKLRASYGTLGNQDFADYQYAASIASGGFGLGGTGYPFGPTQTVQPGAIQRNLANPDIRWQENTEANFGVDLTLMSNLLSLTADYYTREAKGLLVQAPIPSSLGAVTAPFVNAGTMKNSGIELGLNLQGMNRGAVEFDFAATLTSNRNKVTSLGNGAQPIFIRVENYQLTRTSVGAPVGTFFLYKQVGIFQTQQEVDSYTAVVNGTERRIQPNARPGDVKFADLDGDGTISDGDRYAAGHGIPDFEGGMFLNSRFGSFDLGVGMQYSVGNEIMNVARWWTERMDDPTNYRADLRPWTEENPSRTTPRALKEGGQAASNARLNSDRFMEDGSFFRLQNVQLGYVLPGSLSQSAGLRGDSRIYVNFQNVLTLTGYDGLDPEATGIVFNNSSDALLRGVDAGQIYPNPRTVTFGVSLGF